MDDIYKNKYLKYKQKYIELKEMYGGLVWKDANGNRKMGDLRNKEYIDVSARTVDQANIDGNNKLRLMIFYNK